MPTGERDRILDRHDNVVAEPGVEAAPLHVTVLDQQPVPNEPPEAVRVIHPNGHAPIRQRLASHVLLGTTARIMPVLAFSSSTSVHRSPQ